MVDRRVAVEIVLKAAGFLATGEAVEKQTAAVDHEMGQLDRSVTAVQMALPGMAVAAQIAGNRLDDLGDEASGAERELAALKREMAQVTTAALAMAAAAALPVPDAGGFGGGAGRAGAAAGRSFSRGWMRALMGLATPGGFAGLTVAIVPIVSALGAMIGGAVVGTVTGAGILGGLAAASKDAGVLAEAKSLGNVVMGEFFGAGNAIVEPLKKTMKTLGDDFRLLGLSELFSKGAGSVERLGKGISGLVKNLMPGFSRVMDQAEPYTDVFARGLENLGDAISDMVIEMLESEGTLKGLETLFLATGDVIRVTGKVINVLSDAFDAMLRPTMHATGAVEVFYKSFAGVPILSGWTNKLAEAFGWGHDRAEALLGIGNRMTPVLTKTANAATQSTEAIDGMGEALKSATDAAESFTEAQRELIPAAFEVEKSQDDAATAVANLKDALKGQREEGVKGAGSLKGNTKAARDNRDAARDLTETYGNLIIDAASAGKSTKGLEQDFKDTMIQLFGNNEATRHYIDQLDRIPTELLTKIFLETEEARHKVEEFKREEVRMANLARFDIEIGGKHKRDLVTQETARELTRLRNLAIFDIVVQNARARAEIQETARELYRLTHQPATIYIHYSNPPTQAWQFASGGVTPAFQPFQVHAGETFWSSREHYVATAAQSQGLGGGGPTYVINLGVAPGGDMRAAGDYVVRALQAHEASNGTRWRQ